jgi:MoxR-like ATPase
VLLFDEIEKAHPDIFNILLQVFEDGILTDALGNTVDFKNAIIIMTSNIGARFIQKKGTLGFQANSDATREKVEEMVMSSVRQTFNPEFINAARSDQQDDESARLRNQVDGRSQALDCRKDLCRSFVWRSPDPARIAEIR